MAQLHENIRQQVKKRKWTTLMLVDSQAVKNTCNASRETKVFCFYKSTNGIKRHLAVDTLSFPLLDNGYHPEYLTQPLEKVYPDIMRKIRFSPKPSKQEKT